MTRRLLTSLLLLLPFIATAAAAQQTPPPPPPPPVQQPPPPQPPPPLPKESKRPWIVIGGGYTSVLGDCPDCTQEPNYRSAGSFLANVGVSLNSRADIGGEVMWVPSTTVSGETIRTTFVMAVGQFRFWKNRGFFVKGGGGMAFVRNWVVDLSGGSNTGAAIHVQGAQRRHRRRLGVAPQSALRRAGVRLAARGGAGRPAGEPGRYRERGRQLLDRWRRDRLPVTKRPRESFRFAEDNSRSHFSTHFPFTVRHSRKNACVASTCARPSGIDPQPGTRENLPGSCCLYRAK